MGNGLIYSVSMSLAFQGRNLDSACGYRPVVGVGDLTVKWTSGHPCCCLRTDPAPLGAGLWGEATQELGSNVSAWLVVVRPGFRAVF